MPRKPKTLDRRVREAVRGNPNLAVPWYLSAAYAYYHLDRPFLSDGAFDFLAKVMVNNWPSIAHRHKHLITEDDLRGGTLLLQREDYPSISVGAAEHALTQTAL